MIYLKILSVKDFFIKGTGMDTKTSLILGDCVEKLKDLKGESVDLIVTSPPYSDCRKNTYGGIHPDKYVE
jgi:site-specific DNA-methyltransferase (adenine-specific)